MMVPVSASSYASQAIQNGLEDLRRHAGEIAAADRAAGGNGNRGLASLCWAPIWPRIVWRPRRRCCRPKTGCSVPCWM